jgi:hypothetical protein
MRGGSSPRRLPRPLYNNFINLQKAEKSPKNAQKPAKNALKVLIAAAPILSHQRAKVKYK